MKSIPPHIERQFRMAERGWRLGLLSRRCAMAAIQKAANRAIKAKTP